MSLEDPAIPCGLVAKSYFNDTFSLYKMEENGDTTCPGQDKTDPGGKCTLKNIQSKGIAWSSDLEFKFSNIKQSLPEGAKDYKDI